MRIWTPSLTVAVALLMVPAEPVAAQTPNAGTWRDLPVVEIPAAGRGRILALLISGDGGWSTADRSLASGLADAGVSVIGLNAPRYFGHRRTPEEAADDMAWVLRHYLAEWKRERVALVGYSRGANLVPLIANRLPTDLRERLDLVAMLGLGFHAGFHVGLLDVFRSTTNPADPPTLPEIEALHTAGVPLFCSYGNDEKESLCRDAPEGLMVRLEQSGGHRVTKDRAATALSEILRLLGTVG